VKFARVTFLAAGVWGIVVLTPLFWLVDLSGRRYATPADSPHFFYGFLTVAMTWQLVFLLIGADPARFRPLMILSILEKLGFVAVVAVLYSRARIPWEDAQVALPDVVLGLLFVAAFVKTRPPSEDSRTR
jgi:hypothetical protein